MYLFEPDIKMPHSDFQLLVACNNAKRNWLHKQTFYKLKAELLDKYADHVCFDKQLIEIKCDVCFGTGSFSATRRCYRCTGGIYDHRTYYLKRYVLNGMQFHKPVPITEVTGPIKDTLLGYVNHDSPEIEPGFAYVCLLKKYKPAEFTEHLRQFRKAFTKSDMKRWGEVAAKSNDIIEALAIWYGVTVDDLPF